DSGRRREVIVEGLVSDFPSPRPSSKLTAATSGSRAPSVGAAHSSSRSREPARRRISHPSLRLADRAVSISRPLQYVAERRHQDARAALLAPHATVAGAGLAAVVVARIEFPIVDPQFAIEQVQLFDAGVDVRRV